MALGFDVILVGVPLMPYGTQSATAWRRDPEWFDGWELAEHPQIVKAGGYPDFGVFSREQAAALNEHFAKRIAADGTISPNPIEATIISDDDDVPVGYLKRKPPPPTTLAE